MQAYRQPKIERMLNYPLFLPM